MLVATELAPDSEEDVFAFGFGLEGYELIRQVLLHVDTVGGMKQCQRLVTHIITCGHSQRQSATPMAGDAKRRMG